MDYDNDNRRNDSVYSERVKAGRKRTYFFDVRQTKGNDYYLTLTESTKRFDRGGYDRHKIFLYKEDFHRFRDALNNTIEYVKTELMPDYDYDEFTRRHEEWEAERAAEAENNTGDDAGTDDSNDNTDIESEDDMSW